MLFVCIMQDILLSGMILSGTHCSLYLGIKVFILSNKLMIWAVTLTSVVLVNQTETKPQIVSPIYILVN